MTGIGGDYNAYRYTVTVYRDDREPEEVYQAGNSEHDSQCYVSAEDGVGLLTMKTFCESTTREMAEERGLPFLGIEPMEADEEE